VEVPDFEPLAFEQEYGRHIALTLSRSSFPARKDRVTTHGAEVIKPFRETPFERFFFRDPDGYLFEVREEVQCKEKMVQ
jgi:catechol 2,3-dioxygenase-like lactoylglutathione lyase family enzyme